jgi:KDO2-lipid IV(A) lauroyltransferase
VTLRHRLEYAAVRCFGALVSLVGVRAGYVLADLAGSLIHLVDGRHRRIARENLRARLTGPDGSPPPEREVRRIARASFQHLVRNGVEMLLLERTIARRGFDAIVETDGLHHLQEAATGPGAILVTGHLGNWEVMGATCRDIGVEGRSVYRPLDNPLLDRWVRSLRSGLGQDVVPKEGAVRGLLRGLKEGRVVAVLIDQDPRRHGIFVPFFGTPASTIPTPAELAIRTGARIITAYALRVGPGFRYHERFDPPLEAPQSGDREADVRAIMTELNRRLEAAIRSAPEQWLWAHRRWKTRPPGEGTDER